MTANIRAFLFHEVSIERERQDAKWNFPQTHSVAEWATILAEEFGEVAMEANEVHFRDRSPEALRTELIQVAAVCISWLEHMEVEGK